MSSSPLDLYIKCSRLVFNVEPAEVWEDCDEFCSSLRAFYYAILCRACKTLLSDPVIPKKHHFSCQHKVCLDCIGKKRSTPTSCNLCNDFTLFIKCQQTKLLLQCFQELCELVYSSSWIYDYIQRWTNYDTGQSDSPTMVEIIDAGMNYGRVSILLDDTSSDENSSSSDADKEPLTLSYSTQIFPNISPLSPVKPSIVQSSPEQFTLITDPVIPLTTPLPMVSVPQMMQYQQQLVPSTSKMTPHQPSFIRYPSPMRVPLVSPSPLISKPVMAPVKIQSTFSAPTPTIYSVMYTGSGNKITLKRKPPEDVVPVSSCNNMTILKTDNVNSNFKRPPMQIQQQPPTNSPTPISAANVITTTSTSGLSPNDPSKRRGCRCGNATAAPGKLTCCGQRCPCYVDSKACIDCKCKGCRNPHYVDGHKKMRHHVPDVKTQQQQQQSFLASIQQQTTMIKDIHKSVIPSTSSVIKQEDFGLMDQSAILSKSPNSINNCIISMNSNGQYQIKQSHPRIIVKEPVKTMSPLMFPGQPGMLQPTTVVTTIGSNSGIQILGVYSQVPMLGTDKKIIIKNEPTVSFADTTKQLLESSAAFSTSNLNTNLL